MVNPVTDWGLRTELDHWACEDVGSRKGFHRKSCSKELLEHPFSQDREMSLGLLVCLVFLFVCFPKGVILVALWERNMFSPSKVPRLLLEDLFLCFVLVCFVFLMYFFQVYILQRMKWVELRGLQISNTFLAFVFVLFFFFPSCLLW